MGRRGKTWEEVLSLSDSVCAEPTSPSVDGSWRSRVYERRPTASITSFREPPLSPQEFSQVQRMARTLLPRLSRGES